MVKVPEITINGIHITPNPPKARIWRKVIEFEEHKKDADLSDFVDGFVGIIVETFGRDDITPEVILDNLALSDIMPLYHDCYMWVMTLISGKLSQIPNAETAAE